MTDSQDVGITVYCILLRMAAHCKCLSGAIRSIVLKSLNEKERQKASEEARLIRQKVLNFRGSSQPDSQPGSQVARPGRQVAR